MNVLTKMDLTSLVPRCFAFPFWVSTQGSLALGADGGHVGVVLGIFVFRVGQGGFLLLP